MKSFLVIGMGRFGTAVAQELTELGQEVLAIDENVESVQRIADDVTQVMQGDAQDEAVLGAVGVRNFDCCIVAVGTDMEASILITVMLKDLGAQYIIAKARSTVHAKVLERVGADRVVLPESEMGCKLAQRLAHTNVVDFIGVSDEYSILEIHAPKSWVGRSLVQLDVRQKHKVNVLAVRHGEQGALDASPKPDRAIEADDLLFIMGENKFVSRVGERKYRRSTEEMLCEGEKMLGEALRSGAKLKTVLVRDGWDSPFIKEAEGQGAVLYSAPDALFKLASEVETPQNVIFSCEQPQWTADALDGAGQVLLLDGLQDPGNLGTILRTAEAFALGAVVLCEGCADPFSPKVVRSTMGAVFRLPCVTLPLAEAAERLHRNGLPLYATALHEDSVPLSSVSLSKAAVIIGSEGKGVTEQALRLSDKRVIIPMKGRAESLNAGVAAAIVIYEMTK